jgi:hypothetical protein
MISGEEFGKAISSFDELEKRGSFYDMAINLINNGFEIEAYLLILATWNFAQFRYAVKDFDIQRFKNLMKELRPCFGKMRSENFRTINFDKYRGDITKIFDELSVIKGVGPTGASKIMHLVDRKVFVMWDGYIRAQSPGDTTTNLRYFGRDGGHSNAMGTTEKVTFNFSKRLKRCLGTCLFKKTGKHLLRRSMNFTSSK